MRRPKPLADLLAPVLGPALAAQGFTGGDVISAWPEIVGERLAARSRPLRVEWPRRRAGQGAEPRDPATLILRVESAFALELQHLAPVVLERINAVYGWRCVGKLVLKQGPVARAGQRRRSEPVLSAADRNRVAEAVASVGAEPLREALSRLGCAVASDAAPRSGGPACHDGAEFLAQRPATPGDHP